MTRIANRLSVALIVLALGALCSPLGRSILVFAQTATPAAEPAGILKGDTLQKLLPPSVFFRGQSAPIQLRNSAAIRFPDQTIMFAAKVDTGGYATSIQERYQIYLVTEDALLIGGKELAPGAYGVGFIAQGFLVMDLGGHLLMTVPAQTQADLRRPVPLQITQADGGYRLYSGRTYVTLSRSSR